MICMHQFNFSNHQAIHSLESCFDIYMLLPEFCRPSHAKYNNLIEYLFIFDGLNYRYPMAIAGEMLEPDIIFYDDTYAYQYSIKCYLIEKILT